MLAEMTVLASNDLTRNYIFGLGVQYTGGSIGGNFV